jgi:diguanylate cyclase (GGDEF)-like protein/PAS domain S-box-containing protein
LPSTSLWIPGLSVALAVLVAIAWFRRRLVLAGYESLFAEHTDAVATLDRKGRIRRVNRAFTNLTGLEESRVRRLAFSDTIREKDRARALSALRAARRGEARTIEAGLRSEQEEQVDVELTSVPIVVLGRVVGTHQIARDIRGRKETDRKLQARALLDYLTGLPNRALFQDRLRHALDRGRRTGQMVGLLYLDLDRFKQVNDTAGHEAGDLLLQTVASRLESILRDGDTVARLGGDEFAILLEDMADEKEAIVAARRVADLLSKPVRLEVGDVNAGGSVGVVISRTLTESPEELVRRADLAMYEAKRRGGHRYQLYTPALDDQQDDSSLNLEGDLRDAIEADALGVDYQAIIDLAGTRIVGIEALARWRHPRFGSLSPSVFIPIAERSDLIGALDRCILRRVCRDARTLLEDPRSIAPGFFLSVNCSQVGLEEKDAAASIIGILEAERFDPQRLQIELTQSVSGRSLETLERLREAGIKLAIDDFGTGYSSLGYLGRLQVDVLKIDRSLTRALGTDTTSGAAVRTILTLARVLALGVIVEGVEDVGQLRQLQELGGRYVQGFYFGQPTNFEAISNLVRRGLPPDWAFRGADPTSQLATG